MLVRRRHQHLEDSIFDRVKLSIALNILGECLSLSYLRLHHFSSEEICDFRLLEGDQTRDR